jgi:hypothetical protein
MEGSGNGKIITLQCSTIIVYRKEEEEHKSERVE